MIATLTLFVLSFPVSIIFVLKQLSPQKKAQATQLFDTKVLVYLTTNKRAPTPMARVFLLIVPLS